MDITPSNLSFRYKKYLSAPYADVKVEIDNSVARVEFYISKPWIKVISNGFVNENGVQFYIYKIAIDPAYADVLPGGIYGAYVGFDRLDDYGNPIAGQHVETLNVGLELIDTVKLSFSKSNYSFEYILGDPAPPVQLLTVFTENGWNIVADKPWLNFSSSNGNATQTINLGVDVQGMAVGLYEATFQADDGQTIKQGTVSLLITGAYGGGDYLNVSRSSLSFSEVLNIPPTRSASVTIETSLDATVTTPNPWLNISQANLVPGTTTIIVSTQNTEALALGTYTGSIKIESGFSVKTISVILRIMLNETSGIESNKLYFAKDRNTLFLTSATPNAEAFMEFDLQVRQYSKRAPYFDSVAEVIIGMETAKFLQPSNLPAVLLPGAFSPVAPLSINFKVYDKVINSTEILERQAFTNVQFLNGKSPAVPNVLSNIPSRITAPKDGLVSFSFYSATPVASIKISGSYSGTLNITGVNSNVFSAVVDLANLNLKAKDRITIAAGPVTVEVVIRNPDFETFQLIWLNQWDCPEIINFDGEIETIDEDDSTKVTVSEAGKIIERIVDVNEPMSFKVGTGNIYSDSELKWLAHVLRTKKAWLQIGGNRTEVIKKFSNITTSKSRSFNRNLVLNFDAAVR